MQVRKLGLAPTLGSLQVWGWRDSCELPRATQANRPPLRWRANSTV